MSHRMGGAVRLRCSRNDGGRRSADRRVCRSSRDALGQRTYRRPWLATRAVAAICGPERSTAMSADRAVSARPARKNPRRCTRDASGRVCHSEAVDNPPDSFDEERMTEWSEWGLDHGLPPLPTELGRDESVPVARWVGPRFAAVMHVQWWRSDQPDEPDELENESELFIRRGGRWEVSSGSGGSGWYDPPFQRPDIPPNEVWFDGELGTGGDDWYAYAIDGIAGTDATTVEVEDADGRTTMPIESPLGAFLVALDPRRPATIRGLLT